MEWDHEKSLELIDAYEKTPVLWNQKHGSYYNKFRKYDAWAEIDRKFGCPMGDSKKKMESLLGSFRREKSKGKRIVGTGNDRREVYSSQWFAFNRFSFLLEKNECKVGMIKEECPSPVDCNGGDESDHTAAQSDSHSMDNDHMQEQQELTSPKRAKKRKFYSPKNSHSQINQALALLKNAAATSKLRGDECGTYGEFIAHKLRTYSKKTRCMVQDQINSIIFNADMGQYDHNNECQSPEYQEPILKFEEGSPVPSPMHSVEAVLS